MKETTILFLGILGLLISSYILYSKSRKKPINCILGDKSCNQVINSEYGKTLGFENSALGLAYFIAITIFGLAGLFNPVYPFPLLVYYCILGASSLASLFSLYLVGVQIMVLKKFCEYCFASTAITIAIFLVLVL